MVDASAVHRLWNWLMACSSRASMGGDALVGQDSAEGVPHPVAPPPQLEAPGAHRQQQPGTEEQPQPIGPHTMPFTTSIPRMNRSGIPSPLFYCILCSAITPHAVRRAFRGRVREGVPASARSPPVPRGFFVGVFCFIHTASLPFCIKGRPVGYALCTKRKQSHETRKTQRLASLLGGAVRRPAGAAAAGGRHGAAQPRPAAQQPAAGRKSQSGVPIRLPKAADRCTVLLCVADETPGFVLAYLNAGQNCIHLLAVPAALEVPFGGKNVPLADCYAAASPPAAGRR
ncbi:MAG: hypothetical protein ACLVJH_13230 [Faecalibacterium prausnitzii]